MTEAPSGIIEAVSNRRQECEEAIARIAQAATSDTNQILKLRRQFGEQLARLVLSVARLQTRAQAKLLEPAKETQRVWWITEKSLQQASAWQVARLKATWFNGRRIYDVCCGIGGDAIHLAQRLTLDNDPMHPAELVAVDFDPLVAAMAAANLDQMSATLRADVRCADASSIEIPSDVSIHIDPDRRAGNHRKSNPEFCQPDWSTVMRLTRTAPSALIKLAPAAQIDSSQLDRMHRCWISLSGSVREQSLLVGESIEAAHRSRGGKSAVVLSSDGNAAWFAPDRPDAVHPGQATRPLAYLIDPDAAIRAAGLTMTFADQYQLRLLGRPSGFLTSDECPRGKEQRADLAELSELSVVGHVTWSGSCDDRKLRRELRQRDVYPAIVKVRGTDHDPAVLTKRYRVCGQKPVGLWIGRASDRAYAAIVEHL